MEKKLITLVFIALLVGLGGGYGLGYMVYQPQILGFQSDLEAIKKDVQNLKILTENTTMNVNVTNLPLDEQGNLKVSYGASKIVTVEKDLNVTYYEGSIIEYRLTTAPIEVEGFKEFYVYASGRNWTTSQFDFMFRVISIVDGIESFIPPETGTLYTYPPWLGTWDGNPKNLAARYYVWGPTVKIEIWARDVVEEEGWFLVSISLYLRN